MRCVRVALNAAGGAVMLALAWAGVAQADSIVGSDHDILFITGGTSTFGGFGSNVQICNFCHTPHFATTNQPPLWNRSDPVTTAWTMYSSPTMDATNTGAPQGVSLGCLSCHDGATALDAGTGLILTAGGVTSPTLSDLLPPTGTVDPDHIIAPGGNLADDHPISIEYGLDSGLHPVTVTGTGRNVVSGALGDIPLYGASGDQVECASCHDPHDPANFAFLRISNNDAASPSALCLTCHDK